MASIRGALLGAQVAGSISSVVFSRNASGAYIRARSVPVNPKTPEQEQVRIAMSQNSNAWNVDLTPEQRQGWEDYAQGTPLPDRFGEPVPTKGRQMYLRTNNARVQTGGTRIDDAPITPGVADAPSNAYTGNTADGIEVTLTDPVLVLGDAVQYRLGIAVQPAVNFYASPFQTAAVALSATPFPLLLKPAAEVAIGQRYFMESRLFLADGKVSFLTRDFVDILV